ncbi:PD-(D/E)XK nuclease family protein [Candidatus Aciduliprofundum boonei]|uniref:PD-(D/E)XK endonuclease-like domain-containing protein n=1 Tax=Aciduliprofundum boonei (strain DSM 19572 / T469) TaxID=439481 RepID=B5ICN7_ACIB4|nr:PD-(D/E)XK nuclease family protein [Candidatus Aciduliprofundum boonei]ADD09118.1 hypothetical protein Aboo_1310 [Aciduliprofundum boonei T469]EDY36061.1 hypothetical protein ABOONEI_3022 [Aciduliprofundum boonei T469]HII55370.1 PD-(D/E)XK nuclease family protein [Candidatus Aciduliprofundum boonei]
MKLSYSAYMSYKTCPRKYYYERVYPIPQLRYADSEVGNYLHNYFYSVLNGENESVDADKIWEKIKGESILISAKEIKDDFQDFDDMVAYYSSLSDKIILWRDEKDYVNKIKMGIENSIKIAKALNLKSFNVEKWMNAKIDDLLIYGRFDIISENDIFELKTGGEREDYYLQLAFYALIFYLKNYIIPRGRLVYLQNGKIIDVKFNFNVLNEIMEDVIKVGKGIKNEDFPANKGENCRFCPYKFICDY